MAKPKPVHKIRHSNIKAAVWENSSKNGSFLSVTFSRSYKNGSDWKDVQSFSGPNDLTNLIACVFDAYRFVCKSKLSGAIPEA